MLTSWKRWIPILALGLAAVAQSPGPVGTVNVVLTDGTVASVRLIGFVVQRDGLGYTMQPDFPASTASAAAVAVTGENPARVDPANPLVLQLAQMPAAGTLRLFRNGLRQSPGVDYAVQGRVIAFVPAYAGDENPLVVADYVVAQ